MPAPDLVRQSHSTGLHESFLVDGLPTLRIFDMTKRTENILKVKRGMVSSPDDLHSDYVLDTKLVDDDIPILNKKTSKIMKKRRKDVPPNV